MLHEIYIMIHSAQINKNTIHTLFSFLKQFSVEMKVEIPKLHSSNAFMSAKSCDSICTSKWLDMGTQGRGVHSIKPINCLDSRDLSSCSHPYYKEVTILQYFENISLCLCELLEVILRLIHWYTHWNWEALYLVVSVKISAYNDGNALPKSNKYFCDDVSPISSLGLVNSCDNSSLWRLGVLAEYTGSFFISLSFFFAYQWVTCLSDLLPFYSFTLSAAL